MGTRLALEGGLWVSSETSANQAADSSLPRSLTGAKESDGVPPLMHSSCQLGSNGVVLVIGHKAELIQSIQQSGLFRFSDPLIG